MQKYAKAKDSGIEWVGPIPEHWSIKPLFALFRERQMPNYGNRETNVLSLSYGKIIRRDVESNFGLLPESFETYNIVEPENIVLRLTDLQNDKRSLRCGFVGERGIITSAYLTLEKLQDAEILPAYAYYLLHSYDMRKVFYGMGGGVRQVIKFEDIKRMLILLPPLDEQGLIVRALAEKERLIDSLIVEKEHLIELLYEKKATTINAAMTRGLQNFGLKLKDANIDQLPQVPSHWAVLRSDGLVGLERELISPEQLALHDRVFHYSIPAVQANGTGEVVCGREISSAKQIISRKVVLVSKLNPRKATVCIAEPQHNIVTVCSTEFVILAPYSKKVSIRYLNYLCSCEWYRQRLDSRVQSATRSHQRADPGEIYKFWCALPLQLPEQEEIVAYLDREVMAIDMKISAEQKKIDLLREYKSALASSVVFGRARFS